MQTTKLSSANFKNVSSKIQSGHQWRASLADSYGSSLFANSSRFVSEAARISVIFFFFQKLDVRGCGTVCYAGLQHQMELLRNKAVQITSTVLK